MHLFLNGLAASAGGGLTYLRNVLPQLSGRGDVQVTAALSRQLRPDFRDLPRVALAEIDLPAGAVGRFWQEQRLLPAAIRRSGADVLVSAGNFALRKSPLPQILLSRNSLYTSGQFLEDLRRRRAYGLWLDTRIKGVLARRSVAWADCTVAPSEAFAQELRQWTGREVRVIHHGFDREAFFRDQTPLSADVRQKLEREADSAGSALRLLYVSHYNYYRNFETLLRALPALRQLLGSRKLQLFLTCRLHSGDNSGSYRAQTASDLVTELGVRNVVVELGAIPYSRLHQVYRDCDVYVTPAYAESFAHPLVEAMASGLPIVASGLKVHREICQDAALYFKDSDPEDLARQVFRVADSADFSRKLSNRGLERSHDFSWKTHVDELLALAEVVLGKSNAS